MVEYRKDQLNSIENVLKKVSKLIAFIRVYGTLYDDYYYALILNINNISERYLENFDAELIHKLYNIYLTAKQEKNQKEKFLNN